MSDKPRSPETPTPEPGPSGPRSDFQSVRRTLQELEQRLDTLEGDAVPTGSLATLRAEVASLPDAERRRLASRVARLEGRMGLRVRDVPSGTLDDLYERVRERLPAAPMGGGMSLAFLDAPRSLRVWRGVAVAACLVLAVGAGIWGSDRNPAASPTGSAAGFAPTTDPRSELLQPLVPWALAGDVDASSSLSSPRRAGVPLTLPAGGSARIGDPRFFLMEEDEAPAQPVTAQTEIQPRWN